MSKTELTGIEFFINISGTCCTYRTSIQNQLIVLPPNQSDKRNQNFRLGQRATLQLIFFSQGHKFMQKVYVRSCVFCDLLFS